MRVFIWAALPLMLLGFLVSIALLALLGDRARGVTEVLVMIAGPLVGTSAPIGFALFYLFPKMMPSIVEWSIARGKCPTCIRTLRDVPIESDGCCVCTQCRAAWRFPKQLVVHEICKRCRYDCSTHNPEADGMLVCPECGERWQVVSQSTS